MNQFGTGTRSLGCRSNEEKSLQTEDFIVLGFISIFVLLVLLGTLVDIALKHDLADDLIPDKAIAFLQGFSAYITLKKVFQVSPTNTANNLSCINGIRFLSMAWVIFGHSYMHIVQDLPFQANFLKLYDDWSNSVGLRILYNASPSTDSFFLIGSTLLSYLTLSQLEKHGSSLKFWILYYVHRYLRLTGVYIFVIAIAATLMRYMSIGPHHFLEPEVEACRQSWWSNLLYINNFDPEAGRERCIGPTWYMAVDMQFYLVSPLFILPLFYTPMAGIILNSAAIAGSVAYRMYKAYCEREDFTFNTVYIKPWTRISVYTTGLLLGFLLFKTKQKQIKLNFFIVMVGWVVAISTTSAVIFGIDIDQTKLSDIDFMFYQGLFRTVWGWALAWMIFMCVKVKNFLRTISSPFYNHWPCNDLKNFLFEFFHILEN